jgi:hypothetical protein
MASAVPSTVQTPWQGTPHGAVFRYHLGKQISEIVKAHAEQKATTAFFFNVSGATVVKNTTSVKQYGKGVLIGPLKIATAEEREMVYKITEGDFDTIRSLLSSATAGDILLLARVDVDNCVQSAVCGLRGLSA